MPWSLVLFKLSIFNCKGGPRCGAGAATLDDSWLKRPMPVPERKGSKQQLPRSCELFNSAARSQETVDDTAAARQAPKDVLMVSFCHLPTSHSLLLLFTHIPIGY